MPKSAFIGALAGAILLAGVAGPVAHLAAQEQTATLIVLDRDALDDGPPPHAIPAEAVNDLIATVGLRDQLPYFRNNAGAAADASRRTKRQRRMVRADVRPGHVGE